MNAIFEILETFWLILKELWQIWVFVLGALLFKLLLEYLFKSLDKWLNKRWLEKHKSLLEWKKLDGRKFEKITAVIFEKLGYKTKVVGRPGDRGIDIKAHKNGEKIIIQCKQQEVVHPKDILALKGAINEGEQGKLVTTGRFTKEGEDIAKEKGIELINGFELEKLANK